MERPNVHKTLRVAWLGRVDYQQAWDLQKKLVAAVDKEQRPDCLLLLEHPPTYTIGTQRHPEHLLLNAAELAERGIALYEIDRGGDITYHGPGQLVGYPILALTGPKVDLHGYLRSLEEVLIRYLAHLGIDAGRKPEYTGVWVGPRKIAAIGVKANRARSRGGFVTSHGFAFNVRKGIEHEGFTGIVPCGIREFGVTSLEECLGRAVTVEETARELLPFFLDEFGYAPGFQHIQEEEEEWKSFKSQIGSASS
ncbi:lipoyl(octanoyl) transferase LipB [Gorillibacterium sp. CAU 1737]|uniref:lipoyl(octanoyl) transferase LipB n=1 Tax=Gorillibacterium sp. CAU 1737 TaxID=3140362 RepID=UPI0032619497